MVGGRALDWVVGWLGFGFHALIPFIVLSFLFSSVVVYTFAVVIVLLAEFFYSLDIFSQIFALPPPAHLDTALHTLLFSC